MAKLKSRMRTCCAVGGVAKRQYAPLCTPSRSALRTFHIPIPLKAAFTGFEREKRHGASHNSAKLRFTCKAVQTKREPETFFSSRSSKRHVKNTRIFDGFNVSADLALMHLLFLTSSAGASTLGDGTVVYDAEKGSETLKTLGGTAYIVLVVIYVLWVLKKRADRARNEKIASTAAGVKDLDVISDLETEGDGDSILKSSPSTAATMSTSDKVTPAQCFM